MRLPLSSSSSATTIPVDASLSLFKTHAKAEMIQKPLAVLRHDMYNYFNLHQPPFKRGFHQMLKSSWGAKKTKWQTISAPALRDCYT